MFWDHWEGDRLVRTSVARSKNTDSFLIFTRVGDGRVCDAAVRMTVGAVRAAFPGVRQKAMAAAG